MFGHSQHWTCWTDVMCDSNGIILIWKWCYCQCCNLTLNFSFVFFFVWNLSVSFLFPIISIRLWKLCKFEFVDLNKTWILNWRYENIRNFSLRTISLDGSNKIQFPINSVVSLVCFFANLRDSLFSIFIQNFAVIELDWQHVQDNRMCRK